MPNTPSAKKRMRQDAVRRASNRATKAQLRSLLRKCREAVKAKKLEDAEAAFKTLSRKLDQAARSKVIHLNASSRTKSRLVHAIKGLKAK
jgi:small subunit ribosomal protein S20